MCLYVRTILKDGAASLMDLLELHLGIPELHLWHESGTVTEMSIIPVSCRSVPGIVNNERYRSSALRML